MPAKRENMFDVYCQLFICLPCSVQKPVRVHDFAPACQETPSLKQTQQLSIKQPLNTVYISLLGIACVWRNRRSLACVKRTWRAQSHRHQHILLSNRHG